MPLLNLARPTPPADWEKKQKDYLSSFKSAKRSLPKGAAAISCAAKKDEVEVIFPEQVLFTWTKELGERYPNVNLASGEKAKLMIYDRVKLNSKSECSDFIPLFSPADFKNLDRKDDEDNWGFKFLASMSAGFDIVSDQCIYVVGGNKGTKDNLLESEKKIGTVSYAMTPNLMPVIGQADKDGVSDAIVPITRSFKWADGLTELFPGCNFVAGADVKMTSYEILSVKEGKVIKMQTHCDPATCIKPAGKSGAN